MLFSLTGASGAGKSTVLAHLQDVDWGVPVRCVEFDSIGVPDRGVPVAPPVPMQWSRWDGLVAGDPRWDAAIVDTDSLAPHEVARVVEQWMRRELSELPDRPVAPGRLS